MAVVADRTASIFPGEIRRRAAQTAAAARSRGRRWATVTDAGGRGGCPGVGTVKCKDGWLICAATAIYLCYTLDPYDRRVNVPEVFACPPRSVGPSAKR